MSNKIVEYLGGTVKGNNGSNFVSTESFTGSGKVVGLYFSAHWCPPCRSFTPELARKYTKYKQQYPSFEIVFVSSDRSENDFDSYFSEMPWLALPFNEEGKKNKLMAQFGVRGIPALVILNGDTGKVISKDGRADTASETYPTRWKIQ
ncbi:nucleoredoxin-like [Mytilus galloprovincialis]|uniref:nucleoredoxin-like n=1 Tax=Mytilus galloprovincialis TaxID=29158 RepID=UPI003F7C90F0